MKSKNGSQSRKRELRVQVAPQKFELRKNPDGSRSISGYAATFGDLSQDLGGFKEKIQPGAFSQSLQDNPDVLCLYAHDDRQLLGRVSSGTLQIAEDDKGLRFTCKLPDTSTARDLTALMERGDVSHMSFGFACVSDDWQRQPDGQIVRTLLQVVLFEVSVVPQPAYLSSSVDLRSMPAELRKGMNADDEDDCDPEIDDDCDDEEDRCDCDCQACEAGDCDKCSNSDCDDDDCDSCPMQDEQRADRVRLAAHFESRRRNLQL
jgi:uncharacterized protein